MNKVWRIAFMLLIVSALCTPSFAAKKTAKKTEKKYERIVAQIVSLDVAGKTIVVKEEKTGASRTVKISAKAASQVKVGDRVRIKLNPGTNDSAGVRVLKQHPEVQPLVQPQAQPQVQTPPPPALDQTEKK